MGRAPRTVTGRVAKRMYDALVGAFANINYGDFEFGCMLGAAQATAQGLDPSDFDNDRGTDAFTAIFAMLTKEHSDRATIHVTSEWRRVVVSARYLRYKVSKAAQQEVERRYWTYSEKTETAQRGSMVAIPPLR